VRAGQADASQVHGRGDCRVDHGHHARAQAVKLKHSQVYRAATWTFWFALALFCWCLCALAWVAVLEGR
jgi:hypothetical protein